MIDGKNNFYSPGKNNQRPYDNIQKIGTGQEDDMELVFYWIVFISKIVI